MYKTIKLILLVALSLLIFAPSFADVNPEAAKKAREDRAKLLRTPTGVFDNQVNTVSNFEFFNSNYGIFGFDIARSTGGGFWPRGSNNQYLFAGGIWFAARKDIGVGDTEDDRAKLVTISYNPNSGLSWMVPGRINLEGPCAPPQNDVFPVDEEETLLYRTYFSTDFNNVSGETIEPQGAPNWPIWDASQNPEDTLFFNRYFGNYIPESDQRNTDVYPKGPAFISGEDIFSTYKDTDLTVYEQGAVRAATEGYPLQLQYETMIYSWGFGDYKDFIFIKYNITNYSEDTLWSCWMAPVMDVDIARAPNTAFGAGNDRARFYDEEPEENFAFQWTNTDRGEAGFGFGYLGFKFLESPAVIQSFRADTIYDNDGNIIEINRTEIITDSTNFVRKDKRVYSRDEQIGLSTFRNWPIQEDPIENNDRYDFVSSGLRDGDLGAGDKRFMMATGEFHMRPCDTVRVVVGVILANTAKGGEADGSAEDAANLVERAKFAQIVYDNNFQAPRPPDQSRFKTSTRGLNNAVRVQWDSTAEVSLDALEKGLDFMGYRLFRARRTDLDTFNLDNIRQGDLTKGPMGWKQIAEWSIQTPFFKSQFELNNDRLAEGRNYPRIDSLVVVDYVVEDGVIDTLSLWVARIPRGAILWNDSTVFSQLRQFRVGIADIDTNIIRTQPWGDFYKKVIARDPNFSVPNDAPAIFIEPNNPNQNIEIYQDIMLGKLRLNPSLQQYNPILYRNEIFTLSPSQLTLYQQEYPDGLIGEKIPIETIDEKTGALLRDTVLKSIDTVMYYNTVQRVNNNGTMVTAVRALVKRDLNRQEPKNDLDFMRSMVDSIYSYINQGKILDIEYRKSFEDSREVIDDVIEPYFRRVTNNRTYIDVGDDRRDGIIQTSQDNIAINERLINNIPYYYKLIAYDEGDYFQPTEVKDNVANVGSPNLIETFPVGARAGEEPLFEIIDVDSSRIGGLFNFNFFSIDGDRVMQQMAGDTLELTFQPFFFQATPLLPFITPEGIRQSNEYETSLYRSYVTLENVSKPSERNLFEGVIDYEAVICNPTFIRALSEDAASYVFWNPDQFIIDSITGDTITFHMRNNDEIDIRTGKFTSGNFTTPNFCYNFYQSQDMYGTFGFEFNYEIQQWGGIYRPDSVSINGKQPGVDAVTPVNIVSEDGKGFNRILYAQRVGVDWKTGQFIFSGFNNGPGEYLVEFLPGGRETVEVYVGRNNPQPASFDLDYLTIKVTNLIDYELTNEKGEIQVVNYPNEMNHITLPNRVEGMAGLTAPLDAAYYYPDPRSLGRTGDNSNFVSIPGAGIFQSYERETNKYIGNFNLSAYGWVDGRGDNVPFNLPRYITRPLDESILSINTGFNVGDQGKYYLSGTSSDGKQIDFSHILSIGGLQFAFDYANKGSASQFRMWTALPTGGENAYQYGADFKVGDKVIVKSQGGALGLPLPNAKVRVVVKPKNTPGSYTDKIMDGVSIVPNPYYITHQGERSPYDSRIYFTNLPERATIKIYTVTGDLLQTIEHDESSGVNLGEGVDVWNLLTSNGLRVQSQTLVAHITTPSGGETIKNFSIVVGGYRVIQN